MTSEHQTTSTDRPEPAAGRPRDAATLVIVDHTANLPRVLMGRRHPGQIFLPDTFVFPGGRVEPGDRTFARHHALTPADAECLKLAMRGRPTDARAAALALAAVRETFEETGFIVGAPDRPENASDHALDTTGCWHPFLATGHRPRLEQLSFFARAITPPGRPRRYDTRFFVADTTAVADRIARADGELLDVGWFTLPEARGLKLPSITRHVLDDLEALLAGRTGASGSGPVPFYKHRYGRLERTLLLRSGDGSR